MVISGKRTAIRLIHGEQPEALFTIIVPLGVFFNEMVPGEVINLLPLLSLIALAGRCLLEESIPFR